MKPKQASEPTEAKPGRKRNAASPLTPHAAVDRTLALRAENQRRQVEASIRIAQKLGPAEEAIRARVSEHDRERFDRMLAFIAQDLRESPE